MQEELIFSSCRIVLDNIVCRSISSQISVTDNQNGLATNKLKTKSTNRQYDSHTGLLRPHDFLSTF